MSLDAAEIDAESRADSAPKVRNGKARLLTLDDLDGRTRARQRADDLRERVICERGGADRIDALRMVHASTWAVLSAMIEDQLARVMLGEPIEPGAIATLVNARRREGEVIGAPDPRDVTSLSDYLAGRHPPPASPQGVGADVPLASGDGPAPAQDSPIAPAVAPDSADEANRIPEAPGPGSEAAT
jgi:hypothetical protein